MYVPNFYHGLATKGRVGFTTYNNEPIQDFGPKFRRGGAMQDFGPIFFLGGADATQCAFTRHFTVHVKQYRYMLLYKIILQIMVPKIITSTNCRSFFLWNHNL